jgi:flagella basal body P-ring formation protein FlgA
VQRDARTYSEQEVLAALRASIAGEVQVELVDHCRTPIPRGQLSFPWRAAESSICGGGNPEFVWRGQAQFAVNRSMPFWAKVRLKAVRKRVYGIKDIPAKSLLRTEDLRAEEAVGLPSCAGALESMESIDGMESIRRIPAGVTIKSSDLRRPYDVVSGDQIRVEARSESSRVQFTAKAVGHGRKGDTILVQDSVRRRLFRARVTGRKIADVDMGVLVASQPNRRAVERRADALDSSELR